MTGVTYFWSGSNRTGEVRALARHGQAIGVAVQELGSTLCELEALGRRIVVNVTRAGDRPILMWHRERPDYAGLPEGDVAVDVAGDQAVLGFRKVACNVARRDTKPDNVLGQLLRRLFGPDAGARGAGHRVALELTRVGWRMTPTELTRARLRQLQVFVDSGAFSELGGDAITDDHWAERLGAYRRIARALGPRCYLVAPDKVGDQRETLRRLRRFRDEVTELRRLGAQLIVPIQRGELEPAAFDRACASELGFGDYIRGIPSKKAAATIEQIASLSAALPPDARVHLLGLGARGPRFRAVMAALGRPPELVSCDSNRIRALAVRSGGRGGGPRPLTVCTDDVKRTLGLPVDRPVRRGLGARIKELALDLLFERGWA